MQTPYEEHMEAMNWILRYLKRSPSKDLMFRKTDRKCIETYTDSDRAELVIDRKSIFGYCTFSLCNLVTWRSKKQSVIARSIVEAEYLSYEFENHLVEESCLIFTKTMFYL